MFSLEKKEKIRSNIKSFAESLPESVSKRELLVVAVEDIIEEVSFVEREKVDSSDIKLLIVEMREGFKRMDERFASVEKRFEINDKRMDERFAAVERRFEANDKRMEEQFAAVERRFEANDKRMEEQFAAAGKRMDERFEAIDKKFNFMQWMMGFSMAFLAFLITLFSYLKPPISQEMLEKAIISGIEKSIDKLPKKGR